MVNSFRVMLDGDDFKNLIRGEVILRDTLEGTIQIALKDIGFYSMNKHIMDAWRDLSHDRSKPNGKEDL